MLWKKGLEDNCSGSSSSQGTVIIIANHGDRIDIPAGSMLENKIVSGNLRIMDHWQPVSHTLPTMWPSWHYPIHVTWMSPFLALWNPFPFCPPGCCSQRLAAPPAGTHCPLQAVHVMTETVIFTKDENKWDFILILYQHELFQLLIAS